tara:strand:+ start:1032 stop:1673 length:642 start_codon:yes stop_codon:yes gene_type:complete
MFNLINFKSKPKNNPFAPEWNNHIVESIVTNIDISKLSLFLQKKEKDILKLKISNDGYTGLTNHTTTRHKEYNVFNFKNKEINKLKKEIIKVHNKFLKKLNIKLVKSLYIKGWFNIMEKNEYIKPHAHSWDENTYLGGHFCVQCNNTSTHYINPINQLCEPTTYRSKNEAGKLTLFQNFIPHYTDSHQGNSKRITIAFDLSTIPNLIPNIKII